MYDVRAIRKAGGDVEFVGLTDKGNQWVMTNLVIPYQRIQVGRSLGDTFINIASNHGLKVQVTEER